jgi:CBS domain containing-hemolysin-like protein
VKKSLIAFVAAFALTVGLMFLSAATRVALSNYALSSIGFQITNTLISIFLGLVGLAVFFAVFYFLATRIKITANKSTTVAVLLGVLLGSVTPYLLSIVTYPQAYLALYLSIIASSLLSSVFQYFLPALTALLFAELREKKSNHNFTEETNVQIST